MSRAFGRGPNVDGCPCTADKIAHFGVLDPATDFIQKAFTPSQLSSKVHEILTRGLSVSAGRA
jgi:hypothetical protein